MTKFIRIGIADKNDNPPYFDKALYEAEVDENEDIQHTVLTVTAKDHDECEYLHHCLCRCLFGRHLLSDSPGYLFKNILVLHTETHSKKSVQLLDFSHGLLIDKIKILLIGVARTLNTL